MEGGGRWGDAMEGKETEVEVEKIEGGECRGKRHLVRGLKGERWRGRG
jgi:hypothetical protein